MATLNRITMMLCILSATVVPAIAILGAVVIQSVAEMDAETELKKGQSLKALPRLNPENFGSAFSWKSPAYSSD